VTDLVLTDKAALGLLDEAERALAEVSTPEDADEIWRKVRAVEEAARLARLAEATVGAMTRVRLRAKRRWGQLLPEPASKAEAGAKGGSSDTPSPLADSEKKQVERARKLAAIPQEAFEAALENTEPDKPPTEAALLRQGRSMTVHFSSETDEWSTPQDLFDELSREFRFDLDVCALPSSAKCKRYFTPEDDGLSKPWKGTCWMNPPYGEVIGKWMSKALEAAGGGVTVVCLVPARVDTAWWWDTCLYGEIRFLRGRLKFGGSSTSAPFPSAVVIFGPGFSPRVRWWER
jgi:phage N-6-adenine-methyltransferase